MASMVQVDIFFRVSLSTERRRLFGSSFQIFFSTNLFSSSVFGVFSYMEYNSFDWPLCISARYNQNACYCKDIFPLTPHACLVVTKQLEWFVGL